MKIRLFGEAPPEREKEVVLKLYRQSNPGSEEDEFIVGIVNDNGDLVHSGQLVAFGPDMEMRRRMCINTTLGLPLDGSNRLRIKGE